MSERVQLVIRVGYHGPRFHGVASQRRTDGTPLPTVELALRRRLLRATGHDARALVFTSRTDAGVSAEVNYATCWFRAPIHWSTALADLAAHRDDGLVNVVACAAPRQAFARNLAETKTYRYVIETGWPPAHMPPAPGAVPAGADPRWRAWCVVPSLDPSAMRAATVHLTGTHDFTSFCAKGRPGANPTKTLHRIDVDAQRAAGRSGDTIRLTVEGSGFLRKMVRIMAGTLAEVGAGLRPADSMPEILEARDRRASGLVAPARGLTLAAIRCAPQAQAWLPRPRLGGERIE